MALESATRQMTLNFSFRASKGCTGFFENPEIRLQDVPPGATSIRVLLTQKDAELGGQEVPLPRNGILPAGAVRTFGPCNAGVYKYSVTVKSAAGQILAKAQQSRSFPSDEVAE